MTEAAPIDPNALGEIRTKAGYVYRVTPEDVLWLARSVQFEGGSHEATIWTYAQRQAQGRRSGSLASLLRAHSQPINPLWAVAGQGKCAEHPDPSDRAYCSPEVLARRTQARTITWEAIRPEVRAKVMAWAQARLPNPVPGAIDFADERVSLSTTRRYPQLGYQPVLKVPAARCPRCAWYLSSVTTRAWPRDFVTMHFAGQTVGASGGSALRGLAIGAVVGGGVAVLALGGYLVWADSR